MNLLHICNAYQTNPLYLALFRKLEQYGHRQFVVAPGYDRCGEEEVGCVKVFYFIRKEGSVRRLFWSKKISDISRFSIENIDLSNIDVIHAHTLFSDGAVAYRLWKKYHIPYVVAVRGTDIFDYLRLKLIYRGIGRKILQAAQKVILISPSNEREFMLRIGCSFFDSIKRKIEIIPNGIDDYWLSNRHSSNGQFTGKVLFVGDFNSNKNIDGCLKAIKIIRDEGHLLSFHAVGLKPNDDSKLIRCIKDEARRNDFFTIGEKLPKEKIRELYSQYDLLLVPSFQETFGLVYIEALSQGIPVIWSKNQGIDKMYKDGDVGYAVNPASPKDIAEKIKLIMNCYSDITSRIASLDLDAYDWKHIAIRYSHIYQAIENNK